MTIGAEDAGERLDLFLSKRSDIPSRSFAQHLISRDLVCVDGRVVGKNYHLKKGEIVSFKIPPPEEISLVPEDIPLDILYEDDDVIVLSKPAGMVVHPAHGHATGTLVNAILAHTQRLSQIGGVRRGIVHRLDKNTSGLLVVAKNDEAHLNLARQLKRREVKRSYLVLVHGDFDVDFGTIEAYIGRSPVFRKKMTVISRAGKKAITHFWVRERFKGYALLKVDLETGRTHQIRVHMSFIKHPVVGDPQYGRRRADRELGLKRQFLHAFRLQFTHPHTGEEMGFEDKLPEDLERVLEGLRGGK